MAVAPSFEACTDDKLPPKLPMGVRAADKIKTSSFMVIGSSDEIVKNRNYPDKSMLTSGKSTKEEVCMTFQIINRQKSAAIYRIPLSSHSNQKSPDRRKSE